MSNIQIRNLTFGYDLQGINLFEETDVTIDSSWKLGLVGRNGRGKTTFLKLLLGQLPYKGRITYQESFRYFPQPIADKKQLTFTVLETMADFEQWQIEKELNLLKVDPDVLWRQFDTLSGGEQTKVLLALLFVDDVHFPLIDEPTNHLDIVGRQQVADYLKAKKQGFIVVSHDRLFIDEVVDHILSIERSQIVLYQGNFSVYEDQKKQRDAYELEQNEKLQKEIERLKQTAREKAAWSKEREGDKYGKPNQKGSGSIGDTGFIGARAARTMKRSKAIEHRLEGQIEEKEGLLKDIEQTELLRLKFEPTYHKRLIEVNNLQLSYDGRPLFKPITFQLNKGDRLAIIGPNGSGKSSLLAYLLGHFKGKVTGEIVRPDRLTISLVRQNYEDNKGTLQAFAKEQQLDYQQLLMNLRQLGTDRFVFENRIEDMSMGQRKRVEMAKSLVTPAELFLWDEPLNYLDVFNQEQLEQAIQAENPTMVIIEHDEVFIERVATKKIILEKP